MSPASYKKQLEAASQFSHASILHQNMGERAFSQFLSQQNPLFFHLQWAEWRGQGRMAPTHYKGAKLPGLGG